MSNVFSELGLMAELVRAVSEEGYTTPTPVQAQAIPTILAGRDVLAGAQTGTGKTAGFTLPLLQILFTRAKKNLAPHSVRALVLTPTRELAAQVEESVRTYGKYLPLKSALVFGGVNINPQIQALRRGVDILVATPGRLLDHAQQKTVDLSHVEILVLDEADRMLDMGFIRDIKRVLALLPKTRQNLLFSATYSDEIRELADGLLHNPAAIEVARRNADSELVTQRIHPVNSERKRELLTHLVQEGDWHQVLVFTRTKHGANRLAEQLEKNGIGAMAIHGNKSQAARTKALAGFKDGSVRVLVATDIAARGLDIEELPHVVNYELPNVPEDYVHRIGRTGRAGSTGEAISLVGHEEMGYLTAIEKLLKKKLERTVVPGFEPGAPPADMTPPASRQQQRHPPRDGGRHARGHQAQPPRGRAPQGQPQGQRSGQKPKPDQATQEKKAQPRPTTRGPEEARQPSGRQPVSALLHRSGGRGR